MHAKGPLRVLVLLLAVSLLPVLAVSAHHDPQAKDVVDVAVASPWLMSCKPASGQQVCTDQLRVANRQATITPDSGPLASVTTKVNAVIVPGNTAIYAMQATDQSWNAALHDVGCASPNAVGAFMANLGANSIQQKTVGPTTAGECSITGSLIIPLTGAQAYYTVTSRELPSALPTPTPTPTPKPTATPTPTLQPTATPKPTAGPTTRPTTTAKPTAAAGATATATATATGGATATESASVSPTAIPANTPEQTVLGFTFTPEPSSAPPAPAGNGGDDWAGSVPSASQVSTDATKLAGSGLAALLLLLAMGFIGELFNNTFEANYDRIQAGWQQSWLGKVGKAFSGLWRGGK